MTRLDRYHPAALAARDRFHADTVSEVTTALARNKVVVVGMAWNPHCKKARQTLQAEEIAHTYLEYGNYLSGWRERLAIKMWSGWPTFPQVFIGGTLIGGASDLAALRASGELKTLVSQAA